MMITFEPLIWNKCFPFFAFGDGCRVVATQDTQRTETVFVHHFIHLIFVSIGKLFICFLCNDGIIIISEKRDIHYVIFAFFLVIGHCLFRLKFATTQNEFTIQTIDLNFKFQIAHLFLSFSQSLCSSGSCS